MENEFVFMLPSPLLKLANPKLFRKPKSNFIVEPNGTLSNLIVEKEFNHLCTNEAIRIIRDTKWKSGKKNGLSVR